MQWKVDGRTACLCAAVAGVGLALSLAWAQPPARAARLGTDAQVHVVKAKAEPSSNALMADASSQLVKADPTLASAPLAPAEARLLEIYRLVGAGQSKQALVKAEGLVKDIPNFQLAQLVYADLLLARTQAVPEMGHAPADLAAKAPQRQIGRAHV